MNLVTAIQAKQAARLLGFTLTTYANLLLRPHARRGSKFSPILLSSGEEDRIFEILGRDLRKWRWVVGAEHTRYIYMANNEEVRITSVSGFYSGAVINRFNVLEDRGKWLMVETLRAGSDWWKNPIPPHLLHNVYTFKGMLPKCGPVRLPVITSTGFAYIESWQVE